jgi:hypothetical protein
VVDEQGSLCGCQQRGINADRVLRHRTSWDVNVRLWARFHQLRTWPWHECLTTQSSAAEATIRDKNGNILNIRRAFATLLPGLHAAAFAISDQTR